MRPFVCQCAWCPEGNLIARRESLTLQRQRAAPDAVADVAQTEERVEALIDLARAGQRDDFRALALMTGVTEGEVGELWTGTRRRLGREG